jgi:hypothetical protein
MQRDRDVRERRSIAARAHYSECSTAPLLVDLPREEMALLIELVVHMGVN